jgi:hypothetical protein
VSAQSGSTFTVYASSSPDQTTWTTPLALDQGVEPVAALTADDHAFALWQALSGSTSLGIHASERTPAGVWSTPVSAAPTGQTP